MGHWLRTGCLSRRGSFLACIQWLITVPGDATHCPVSTGSAHMGCTGTHVGKMPRQHAHAYSQMHGHTHKQDIHSHQNKSHF